MRKWQTVPDTCSGDRENSVTDGKASGAADKVRCTMMQIRVARCPVFERTVRFLAICPVKNMMLNRTISCPVFGRP